MLSGFLGLSGQKRVELLGVLRLDPRNQMDAIVDERVCG